MTEPSTAFLSLKPAEKQLMVDGIRLALRTYGPLTLCPILNSCQKSIGPRDRRGGPAEWVTGPAVVGALDAMRTKGVVRCVDHDGDDVWSLVVAP
jgi:hypothetical protein